MADSIRGSVAIVGAGTYGAGSSPGWTPLELMQKATMRALDDAGLVLSDIDGLCASTFYHFFPSLSAAEQLGIKPRWSSSDMVGGSSFMNYVIHAAAAIKAGLCQNVLILYGSNARSSRNLNGLVETPETEQPWEPMVPLTSYSLTASRYMYQYGVPREALGNVHLSARSWAALNPEAELRDPITMDEYLSARMIASPISKFDCCLMSDGGAAIVLTGAERAKDANASPVYLLGGASAHWHREIAQMPDMTVTAAAESSAAAYSMAGLGPREIDVVQVYDAFTLNVLLFLEDLGFVAKGEAADFVASGAIQPGGSLPLNTNGGGLCCVHPGMYGLFCIIEAVTQLRGEGGDRQVDGAETAIAHGNGGALSHQSTLVFGTEAAL